MRYGTPFTSLRFLETLGGAAACAPPSRQACAAIHSETTCGNIAGNPAENEGRRQIPWE